jgi:hypothetical protein
MFNTVNGYFKQGLYAEALNIVADDDNILYSAVFRPGSGAEWVVPAEPWSSIATVIDNYFKQGLYVSALSIAEAGNEVLYSAVFRPGSGAERVVSAQPWSQFATTVSNYFKQGLYVAAMAATMQNGVVLYSAAFRPGSGAEWVVSAQPWSSFATTVNNYFKQGLYATGSRWSRARAGRSTRRCFVPVRAARNGCSAITCGKISPSKQIRISPRASTRPALPPADWRSSAASEAPTLTLPRSRGREGRGRRFLAWLFGLYRSGLPGGLLSGREAH